MCADAYASFSHAAVAPLTQLAPGRFLLELFHGPSLRVQGRGDAAAGAALRPRAGPARAQADHRLRHVRRHRGAAVEAFRGRANVRLVAMFPQGRISDVQRRFMTTADEANVACLAVKGDFDDCQAMLKEMFRDAQFVRAVDLSGVNSINFARIAAQSVYYFTAAVALGAPGRKVAFAAPTGNFGDAYAGYVASRMGLPIERIIVAVNANDILCRALATAATPGRSDADVSPAMDNSGRLQLRAAVFRDHRPRPAGDRPRLRGLRGAGRDRRAAAQPRGDAQPVRRRRDQRSRDRAHHPLHAQRQPASWSTRTPRWGWRPPRGSGRRRPRRRWSAGHRPPRQVPETVKAVTGVEPHRPNSLAALAARAERFETIAADVAAAKDFVRKSRRMTKVTPWPTACA